MQKHSIGTTDILVSKVGLGTVKFGRQDGVKYLAAFTLPTDAEITYLLDVAKELGINLLDTAPAYGNSEERIGKIIRNQRKEWVISTKAGEEWVNGASHFDFSALAIQKSVERSLRRLQTEYIDILLIHSNGEDIRLIEEEHVFDTLSDLKASGKIRAFGMSTKTIAGGLRTIELADLAMVTLNPQYTEERCVIAEAAKKKKGIFIKKALNSGHLAAKDALQFALSEPGVTSVVIGTINPEHLRENLRF